MNRSMLAGSSWLALMRWHGIMGRHYLPWRLEKGPWAILVAEVLLHRTRADQVARAYPGIIERFSSPTRVAEAPELWIQMTDSLGLGWRTRGFIETSRELLLRFHGQVPQTRAELLSLPGVGHYIAGAILCHAFAFRLTLVDANTMRLASRLSGQELAPGSHRNRHTRIVVETVLGGPELNSHENLALLDLAALICRNNKPLCPRCPVMGVCTTGKSRMEGVSRSQ